MKPRKQLPRTSAPLAPLRHPQHRGEWAEIQFMAEAARRGLHVLVPYGDSHHYDLVIGSTAGLHKVQVKSTSVFRNHSYRAVAQRTYSPSEIDFMAIYVIAGDLWYIIPAKALPAKRMFALYPHRLGSRGKYERYRDAWHLLGRPTRV